jgi:pyrroloquinoline quinone biosynthesis protein A
MLTVSQYPIREHDSDHVVAINKSVATKFTKLLKRKIIMWTTPAATEMRFGFEVTMYVMNK